ncbi:hypothetical protein J7L68_02215 [bacterium]|nr:hypothetical protein [bacterium]
MLNIPNMIIIGSTGKNMGKTTLVSKIIRKYSCQQNVYAIKISISEDGDISNKKFEIVEEQNPHREKDTSRFLAAGAKKSFLIRTTEQNLMEAIDKIIVNIPKDSIILCESTTLAKYVSPSLFILIKKENSSIKPIAKQVEKYADIIVKY